MKISELFEAKQLQEGTWAIPSTLKTARQLIDLFGQRLPVNVAKKKLYNLLGDDALWDELDELEETCKMDHCQLQDTDVRDIVKNHLKRLIKGGGWKDTDPRAIDELKKFLNIK